MIPRAALAYIKWILPLTNEPVSTINISCAALTKEIPSVLQTQNKTDVHLPNLACIASLSGALLHSPFSHLFQFLSTHLICRKIPKRYTEIQKNMHKNIHKNIPHPQKARKKNSTQLEITHIEK